MFIFRFLAVASVGPHRPIWKLGLVVSMQLLLATSCAGQDLSSGSSSPQVSLKLAVPGPSAAELSPSPELTSHPLQRIVTLARAQQEHIRQSVFDYTCLFVKRERIGHELLPTEQLFVKFRSPRELTDGTRIPFSVYFQVLAPKKYRGREILFVDDQRFESLLVTRGGRRRGSLTLHVDPNGSLAMRDNKYPITSFGFDKLLGRLIAVAEEDMLYDECEVSIRSGAKLDGRPCTLYEVKHPVPRDYFRFHLAQIFVDDELDLPIRYASFDWPSAPGVEPELLEEYTYWKLRLNVGLTDADFDQNNPSYGFRDR